MSTWETLQPKFEDLSQTIEAEIKIHRKKAAEFKQENLMWRIILLSVSVLGSIAVSLVSNLAPSASDIVSEIILAAVIPGLMGFYTWRDPQDKQHEHEKATSLKGGVNAKIIKELHMEIEKRQLAADFYDWIMDDYNDACNASPYI